MSVFTVCIPVYNGVNFLEEALESVAKQTLDGVKVIVSDNASNDGTSDILDRWKGKLDLNVVRQAKTLPMLDHFNAVLDLVDTEFYMILCHDDYLAAPTALARAYAVVQDNPEVVSVYCDLEYVNPQRKRLALRNFKRSGVFEGVTVGRESIRTARNLFGIPLAVRRSKLGGLRYDPDFYYAMDLDLSWAISQGGKCYHIDAPLIANRYGDTNATWSMVTWSKKEFYALAAKYNVPMNGLARLKFSLVNFMVIQQKRIFGAYVKFSKSVG